MRLVELEMAVAPDAQEALRGKKGDDLLRAWLELPVGARPELVWRLQHPRQLIDIMRGFYYGLYARNVGPMRQLQDANICEDWPGAVGALDDLERHLEQWLDCIRQAKASLRKDLRVAGGSTGKGAGG
ncbi:hypothetical protein [Calidithermus chliarophilus]|uniref:hypothetical protein n=1 Tax=Calidithermus chliarophilus TaxID=52023 RepID=UPI00048622C7|nr:hypothetical protein [Calidithermus chliarophilus]